MCENQCIVSYHNDVFFKFALTEGKDGGDIRNFIIQELTGICPKESIVLNPDLSPKQLEGKDIILDVHVNADTGTEYDFEMQMGGEYVSEHKRFEYYGAKMLTYQLNKGEHYESLKEVYQIIFIDAYAKTNRNLINAY